MRIEFILPVNPRPKKNNPRILWKKSDKPFQIRIGKFLIATLGYRPLIIPSERNEEFEKAVKPMFEQVKRETGIINFPINIKAIFYRETQHKIDLTNLNEALHDAMVNSGLLLDDNRDLIAGTDGSRVFYDKFNPRIEITITEMEDYEQWKPTNVEQIQLF